MSIVAGVDFGTQSVRVSLFDSAKGRLGSAVAEYPVIRKREDPDHATQRHSDHMRALAEATRAALKAAGVDGAAVEAIALDTTGSTVIPLGAGLEPLDDYYLWCDHRAKGEAAEITAHGHETGLEALAWCGGVYSSEWGFSKLLHWLRHNPDKRGQTGDGDGALRLRGGGAVRDQGAGAGAAERVRQRAQVDVERGAGRVAAAGVFERCGPAAGRRARQAGGGVRGVERDDGQVVRGLGARSWA